MVSLSYEQMAAQVSLGL